MQYLHKMFCVPRPTTMDDRGYGMVYGGSYSVR